MSQLTATDLDMFAEYGITPELLEIAHIERVSDEEARTEHGIVGEGDMSGIVFPYLFVPNSNGERVTSTVRRDDGEPKYMRAWGDAPHLYFPPNSIELADPETIIVFVEAQKSSLAITQWALRNKRKIVSIAVNGTQGWKCKKHDSGLQPDLACAKGHACIILFDANVAFRPELDGHRYGFKEALLRKLGATSVATPNLPTRGNPKINGPDDFLREFGDAGMTEVVTPANKIMESFSVSALFSAREQTVDFLVWPLLAPGLGTVLDALPKDGKSVLLFRGILAARQQRPFLGHATNPTRVLYISEQSAASLGMQLRECGFDGSECVEELRFIPREVWCRYVFDDFVRTLEKDFLPGNYNAIVWDTFATIARLEDEKDAAEMNRCANLILDVASRHGLALCIGRHDRKSGGDIGVSGRGSGQLSGLVDLILHLTRVPGEEYARKLETRGRVPGLPAAMKIELLPDGNYVNSGVPMPAADTKQSQVDAWYADDTTLTSPEVVRRFAARVPPETVSESTARRLLAKARGRKR